MSKVDIRRENAKENTSGSRFDMNPQVRDLTTRYRRATLAEGGKNLYENASRRGHVYKHIGKDRTGVMQDLLFNSYDPENREKPLPECSNSFLNDNTARTDINEIMMRKADEIAAWRLGQHKMVKPNQKLELYVPLYDKGEYETLGPSDYKIGKGFGFLQRTDDISSAYATDMLIVMKEREGNPLMFDITTAYPRTDTMTVPDFSDDVTDIVKATDAYAKMNPFTKAVVEYKAKAKPADRPFAMMSKNKDIFIISCKERASQSLKNNGFEPAIMIFENGDIKFKAGREAGYAKPVMISKNDRSAYAERYPEQMAIAMEISDRILEQISLQKEHGTEASMEAAEKSTDMAFGRAAAPSLHRQEEKTETRDWDRPKKKTAKRPSISYSEGRRDRGGAKNLVMDAYEQDYDYC